MAPWHKELVFALLQGVFCIGAASMGATRAAELARYQMKGIGKIYEMYAAGEEDDSLVILSYDPETFRPLSVPPVGHAMKRADALEAVSFSRSNREKVSTTLDKDAITPFLSLVVDRILQE